MHPVVNASLPAALAFIMLTLGLGLVPADFRRVLARPRAVAIGLVGQLLLVPLLALLLAKLAGFSAAMALGLMILAACPGGVSSGLLTRLAGGETALSISLTAVTSVVAVLSLPLVVGLALSAFGGGLNGGDHVDLPIGNMILRVFLLTTLPVIAGMAFKSWRPEATARAEPIAGRVATLLFVLIVVATFVDQRDVIGASIAGIGPAILLLNLATMGAGAGLATLGGLAHRDRVAIAMECGLQNAALGIFIAVDVLNAPALAVPSVVYAFLMNVGALALIWAARRTQRA